FALSALQTAEKFRQAVQVHPVASVHQSEENLAREFFEAIVREACRDQGVVMGPHRAVVVGNWVVASLSHGHGTHAPTVKETCAEQRLGNEFRSLAAGNPGVETVAGIGSTHAARLLAPVECQRVGTKIAAPERFLKFFTEALGINLQRCCALRVAEHGGKPGGG